MGSTVRKATRGLVFRADTEAPDVADITHAMVMAARLTDRGAMVFADPDEGPDGPAFSALFDWRWLAIAALRDVWPGCLPRTGQAMALREGRTEGAAMRAARARPWWSHDKLELITRSLRRRHGG